MTTPPKNEKAEDVVLGPFIPTREPPGRLGAIVRRMKRMAPPPAQRMMTDAKAGEESHPKGEGGF